MNTIFIPSETLLFTENWTYTLSNNSVFDALYVVVINRYAQAFFVTMSIFLKNGVTIFFNDSNSDNGDPMCCVDSVKSKNKNISTISNDETMDDNYNNFKKFCLFAYKIGNTTDSLHDKLKELFK